MIVSFYGPRGSIPTPMSYGEFADAMQTVYEKAKADNIDPANFRGYLDSLQQTEPVFFGGNTPCTFITQDREHPTNDNHLIIDAGSGIRQLGVDLMPHKMTDYHLLLGHLHWDHIQGFPFFTPTYIPGTTINIYSLHEDPEKSLRAQMSSPTFPVPWDAIGANFVFHTLEEHKSVTINGFDVEPMRLNHPNVSYGFKVAHEGRSAVYLSDTEVIGADLKEYKRYQDFVEDSQVVIADAQYSFLEYFEKQSWGHSNIMTFIDMLKSNSVERLYMFHHDPLTDFKELNHQVEMAVRYKAISCPNASFDILAAIEGQDIVV